jgi:hypothetical protein
MVEFDPKDFFANYFWFNGRRKLIREDILVKTYLTNYFTLKDLYKLQKLVGKDVLLNYAKEVGNYKRVKKLLSYFD